MTRFPARLTSEKLDYVVDISARLEVGETISSASWFASPTSAYVLTQQSHQEALCSVWVEGGVAGDHYLDVVVTTSMGRKIGERIGMRTLCD